MWLTTLILISILTISAIISSLLAMSWIRKDSQSRWQDLLEMNRGITTAYESLTRTLLGVPSEVSPTATTLTLPTSSPYEGPEAEFGSLPIDEDLMREYEEHLASNSTLSGQPARTNPMVEQITPGMPSVQL